MPIYAYRCSACGHAKDVLQKISDPQLTVCPACGKATFSKQVTAAGFQLKGSGWYATDFRNGSQPKAQPADGEASKPQEKAGEKSGDQKADKPGDKAADKAKPDSGTPAAKPAAEKGPAASPPASPSGQS